MRIGRYLVLIILVAAFFIIFGNRGLLDNHRLKQKLSELRDENSRMESVNAGLKREIILLREDPRYIESIARSEMGMVKKGDMIYRTVDPAARKEEGSAQSADPNAGASPSANATPTPAEPEKPAKPEKAEKPAKKKPM